MGSHAATEGVFGLSLTTEDFLKEVFTFFTSVIFLEFIKVEDMEKTNPKTYLLEEVSCQRIIVNFTLVSIHYEVS